MNKKPIIWFFTISIVLMSIVAILFYVNNDLKAKLLAISDERDAVVLEKDTCLKKLADPAKQDIEDMRDYIMARYSAVPQELALMTAESTSALSKKHNIDFSLVVGLMEVESSFNPFAVSKVGARGLLQVMPKVWGDKYKIVNPTDLHGIKRGISVGIQVLKHYIDQHKGKLTPALAAYNGSKGTEFANSVYLAAGRFTCFRNNTYGKKDTEDADPPTGENGNGQALPAGDTKVPDGVR